VPAPLLRVDGLEVALASTGATIIEEVSLSLEPGETLGVVGESGSGKSVLALTVMGLLPRALARTRGNIQLGGDELTTLSPDAWRDRRGRDMAMIFQEPMTALNPVMRVGHQVEEVLMNRRGMSAGDARRRATALFERVEIPEPARRLAAFPHELSGGMRQRVMITIALAAEPRLLIADEPTTALDVTIQAQILDLLRDLQKERGLALLLITHDLGVIAEITDRVLVLYAGRVAEVAPARLIFDAPAHPYTRALLASRPALTGPRDRLVSIEGAVPSVGAMPPGCRFAPRCSFAIGPCMTAPPALIACAERHAAACVRVGELG